MAKRRRRFRFPLFGSREQRQFFRALLRAPMTVQYDETLPPTEATAIDVSEGGIYIKTTAPLRLGQLVWVETNVDGEPFGGAAEVVRSDAAGYGVSFAVVDAQAAMRLRGYLRRGAAKKR